MPSVLRRVIGRVRDPALALLTAFLLGAVVIVLTDVESLALFGSDPLAALGGAFAGVVEGYPVLLTGAIGDPARFMTALQTGSPADIAAAIRPISETLVSATPFIFAGLGLAVAFQAGLFNLGVDGQFLVGGLGTGIVAALAAGMLPAPLALAVAVVGGMAAGGAYAAIAGVLKARTGAHEVITTLMLNGIAPNLVYLVGGWIVINAAPDAIATVPPLIDIRTVRVDYGFVVALAVAAIVSMLLFRSSVGFELRSTGFSHRAARAAGMHPGRTTILAMTLSGALVGMGSAFYLLGPAWGTGGGPPFDFGYIAIALALLAGRRPAGIVVAAILYGALTTGAKSMVVATGIPLALLTVIVAIAIMFVAAPALTRWIWRLRAPAPRIEPVET